MGTCKINLFSDVLIYFFMKWKLYFEKKNFNIYKKIFNSAFKTRKEFRLKSNRNLLYHNKWTPATELYNRRKGKFKTNVFYKAKTMTLTFHMYSGLKLQFAETQSFPPIPALRKTKYISRNPINFFSYYSKPS